MTATVFSPYHFGNGLADLYREGMPPGDKTGWPSLDRHYSVATGQVTLITGWPGSGKSEWLDALLVNLTRQDWDFCVFSPENRPTHIHIAKLIEKFGGKPFGIGPTPRMKFDEVQAWQEHIHDRFGFLDSETGDAISVQSIIEAAEPWMQKRKSTKRGLIIDPWNELEHWRPKQLSETEYISQQLSHVRNWARSENVHVWIVAHPQKMRRNDDGKLPVPRPDMISGSQHWWNKADACITVFREMDEEKPSDEVHVYVQKVRFKHIGYPGVVKLRYDKVTGKYSEPPPEMDDVSRYRNKGRGDQ